jgi:hypothetical protein
MMKNHPATCCLTAGVTLFAVGGIFHLLMPGIAPGLPPQFNNVALFRPWNGWTSIYMALHPFWYGVVFAGIYLGLRKRCSFPAGLLGGFTYGAGVFLVGSFPMYALVFASFQVSVEVITFFIMQSACQYVAAGVAISAIAR